MTSIVGGLVTFKITEFLPAMARWGCEQVSTAILVIPLFLMYKTNVYLKRGFTFYPLIALALYYCFILKFTAAVNICLIVPILIACAIFYNLRIAAWLVSLNGFLLILLISYGIIKTGHYLSTSAIFTSLNYYRISIVATVSSVFFIAVLVNNNEMIKDKLLKSQWTDDLSQLWNRKGLIEDLKIGRFLGKSETILIAIIDIDNFKQINDSFGHLMGDRVIISLADQLINSFVEAGLYRYGGDEFIIILNVETEQEYKKQLEEFCNQFLANSYQEFDMPITLSIGYTILFENQLYFENFKHLLAHADHALYRSKSLGKNTVSIY
ncbi:GGDEF domain-containing protein [Acinetobacter nectaris]|uniref:GGDEF domain-containing protein n=1 Tax=Acinetobacter nectaris TaxID=1219382 RepID=UPI001F0224E2|nr:diguanylate cyclase [Acinetobacter nectaris]